MSDPAETLPPKRHTLRWVIATLCLCAALAVVAWWVAGKRVWTDDRTIAVRDSDATLREVLWSKPLPPGTAFNTADEEYEPSVSPDGNELYFVRGKAGRNAEIFVSRREHGRWSAPAPVVEINSPSDDLGPRLTPDGRFLLFYSDRPGGVGGYDLWAAARNDDGSWATPFNLGPTVNSEFNEYSPAPTPDGRRLYFATNRRAAAAEQKEAWRATIRQSAVGDYDLFVADRDDASTLIESIVALTAGNGLRADVSTQPATAPSTRRSDSDTPSPLPSPGGRGGTTRDGSAPPGGSAPNPPLPPGEGRGEGVSEAGTSSDPATATTRPSTRAAKEPLTPTLSPEYGSTALAAGSGEGTRLAYLRATEVPGVNTPYHEGASCVSSAGDFLYFASNRPGGIGKFDLYRCRLRDDGSVGPPENLGPQINTPENDTDPSLATGGFHLYFSSDRDSAEARGGYDLLASESREVYVQRQARPTPHLGWSWWVLLLSVLLLLPLLSFFRGWNDHRLNLLQKCLLVSLLFHVLLTIGLSLVAVTKQVVAYVREQGGGMEGVLAVVPGGGGGAGGGTVDIGAEVRRQFTDAPVDMPDPSGLAQEQVAAEAVQIDPAEVAVETPGATARPAADGMTVAVRPLPRAGAAPAVADRVTVGPPSVASPPAAPELNLDSRTRVAQAAPEVRAAGDAPAPSAERAAPADSPNVAPQQVALGVGPAGAGSGAGAGASSGGGGAVASAPHLVRPNMLSVEGGTPRPGDGAALGAAGLGAGPSVHGPSVPSERVAASAPAGAGTGVSPGEVSLQRQGTPGTDGNGPGPVAIDSGLPAASAGAPAAGAGTQGSAIGAPSPAPRVGALLANAGAGAGPTPGATVDPLPAGLRALAGSGTSGPSRPVTAPSPSLAATEERIPSGRAQSAGTSPPAEAGGPADQLPALAFAPAPIAKGGASGGGVTAPSPTTRPVDVASRTGTPRAPGADALAAATGPSLSGITLPPDSRPARAAAPGAPTGAVSAEEPRLASARLATPRDGIPPGPGMLPKLGDASAPPATGAAAGTGGGLGGPGAGPGSRGPRGTEVVPVPLNLEVSIAGPSVAAPAPLAQRSVAARKPLLEKLGGTKKSEDAVDRALAYFARQQEPDGRWTYVLPGSERGERGRTPHDMALTGLATLCFLAADHTPNRTGPYREAVDNAVQFLISRQRNNGDLRGPMAGGGADAGNMYDQGIATLALAEAALMTGDPRTTVAALKGAEFIVKAQNRESGGWRYLPNEFGDTSIFGWQVMALHSAQQLGFEWPQASRQMALKYIQITSRGRNKILGGYQPGNSPTPAMTAELLFCRILMGQPPDADAEQEVCAYLPRQNTRDFYGTYYASLSLAQLQNETWKQWNERTRETLIALQRRGDGEDAGCWDTNITWGERGGRVYSTALACLTLEVYYRYLPMNGANSTSQPATAPNLPDIGYLAR